MFADGLTRAVPTKACRSRIGVVVEVVVVELVAFFVGHPSDGDADDHGRKDKNEDAAAERLNHAGTRGGGLGVAEGAVLGEGDGGNEGGGSQCSRKKDCEREKTGAACA